MSKLEKVLNYMEDNFEGNLDEIVEEGIEKIELEGWELEMWDETKHKIIRTEFRNKKLSGKRRKTLQGKDENINKSVQANYEAQTMPYPYNGKWYDLMNLTKQEIIEISEEYDERAKSNAFERNFLQEIAYRLDDYEQQVKEKFNYEDIRELRSEIKVKEEQIAI